MASRSGRVYRCVRGRARVRFVVRAIPAAGVQVPSGAARGVIVLDVRFDVRNTDTDLANYAKLASAAPIDNETCADPNSPPTNPRSEADGREYQLVGRLVGPRAVLARAPFGQSVSVFVPGIPPDGIFRFTDVAGHDLQTQLAQLGHTTLTYHVLGHHPLGFGDPLAPNGLKLCDGAEADMTRQIVAQLRSGTYAISGNETGGATAPAPPTFDKVALAGLSDGAISSVIEAGSTWAQDAASPNVDALLLMGLEDIDTGRDTAAEVEEFSFDSPSVFALAAAFTAECSSPQGGDPGNPSGSGYGWFWGGFDPRPLPPSLDPEVQSIFYNPQNIDPAVIAAVRTHEEQALCGAPDGSSYTATAVRNIKIPVLLLYGDRDKLCPSVTPSPPDPAEPSESSCQDEMHNEFASRPQGTTDFFQVCKTISCVTPGELEPTHAGHDMVLDQNLTSPQPNKAAEQFRGKVDTWLTQRGF